MARTRFRYQLLRYVADLERMEPINIGIIVQSDDGIAHRIHGHFRPGKDIKPDFDRANFKAWREFFDAEIRRRTGREFAPPPHSREFLEYLVSRCRGNYQLTPPLAVETGVEDLAEVLKDLYQRLVLRPTEETADRASAPVGRFREDLTEKALDRRFGSVLHHNEYIDLDGLQQPFYYWYQNGRTVLIDKVEVASQVRYTQLELEGFLARLKAMRDLGSTVRREVVALLDPASKLPEPESDSDERFHLQYLQRTEEIGEMADRVIGTADEASAYVDELERELAELQTA